MKEYENHFVSTWIKASMIVRFLCHWLLYFNHNFIREKCVCFCLHCT